MENDDFAAELISNEDGAKSPTRRGRGVALVAAGLVAGGALAAGATAFATSSSSSAPSESAGTSTTQPSGQPAHGPGTAGGAASVRSDETELTGADAAKAKAAALKAVPGGTVYRVETDAGDAAYEAHMKKADGTLVTVKLDKNFVVTKVESGMGLGDPRPTAGHGDNDGDGPGGTPPSGTNPEHA